MTKYKPYSIYKPSGVEWLGEIPKHWQLRKLKFVAPPSTEKLAEKPSEKIYLGLENIESKTGRLILDSPIEVVDSIVTVFHAGDVLFGKLRPYLAKVVCATFDGVCTSELLVLRPSNKLVDEKYLFYLLLSDGFINFIDSMTYGVKMPRANPNQICNIVVSIPLLKEQKSIAHFLDREITRIDTLITKKREMIDLLERKRAEIVTEAVTKGCDRNVSMKNSGISWIGEIPKHWLKIPIKYVCLSVRDGTHNPPAKVEGEYRLLSARNIQDGEFILRDDDRLMDADAFAELQRSYTVCKGDVVVAVVGATTGKSAVVGDLEKISVQRSIAILKPNHSMINSNYLNFWISSPALQHEIALTYSKYAAQGGIYLEDLANLTCVLPSLKEQTQILSLLDKSFTPLLKAEQKLLEQIDELQKYRQALITAAVTGKIDVREEIKSDRGVA